ncbi:MAG: ABC transporter ATP-binding protein [Pleurocapsa minor GSE-CHR-MK-17-07R]|nr:ABC transporter ATP-binding protein [Pleurocapsa minor GSE-CHR-MK 17-07R]
MSERSIRLKLEHIVKAFPDRGGGGMVRAVDDISLDIYSGEFLTLLGPSGCGKTTTLRLIAGFELPTEGRILLDGQDITPQPPNKRDMALVFQNYALFPHMSVYDNVAYGLETRRLPRQQIRDKVQASLKQIGLEKLDNRRPNQLSGGQQQRVALARSLVMEPRILLFDEPLSNLDAKLRVQMRSEIHRLQRRLGITSIYVTHDQVEAMALSDRIVVMNKGRIEQIGSPQEIYRYPATRFVADFIGRANFIEDVPCRNTGGGQAQVDLLGKSLNVPIRFEHHAEKVTVLLRPEALVLREDPSLKQVVIDQAMYLGSEVEYVVSIDDRQLVVVEQDPRLSRVYAEGQTVGIDFVAEAVHLLPR